MSLTRARRRSWRPLRHGHPAPHGVSGKSIVGTGLLASIVVLAVAAPLVSPYDPATQHGAPLASPSMKFLLGTDELGRDILSRLLFGARATLLVAAITVPVAAAVGTVLGIVAGYAGGSFDSIAMRVVDVLLAFPAVMIGLTMAAILGPDMPAVIAAITIASIPVFARLARGRTLTLRSREFVESSAVMGATPAWTLRNHILPNVLPTVAVQVGIAFGIAMLLEAGLSYLGLGVQPPAPSWGGMLQRSQTFLRQSPVYAIAPGLALTMTVVSINLLVDGYRESTHPRPRRLPRSRADDSMRGSR